MCEQKPDTRTKIEKLIDAMDRLSAALERQSIKDRGHNWRYPSTAYPSQDWLVPGTDKM